MHAVSCALRPPGSLFSKVTLTQTIDKRFLKIYLGQITQLRRKKPVLPCLTTEPPTGLCPDFAEGLGKFLQRPSRVGSLSVVPYDVVSYTV